MLGTTIKRARADKTIFFLCDMQAIFEKKIYNMPAVIHSSKILCRASGILNIPLIATEHKPKAFGRTIQEIKDVVPEEQAHWFEKTRFSMVTDDVSRVLQENKERDTVVLFGIETHVCIQQTTLDLLEMGYNVHLIADGVSSQREHDRNVALTRLVNSGACLTTMESIIFELLEDSASPLFKKCLPLFKEERPDEKFPNL